MTKMKIGLMSFFLFPLCAFGMFDTYELTNLSGRSLSVFAVVDHTSATVVIPHGTTTTFEPIEFGRLLVPHVYSQETQVLSGSPGSSAPIPIPTTRDRSSSGAMDFSGRSRVWSVPLSPQMDARRIRILRRSSHIVTDDDSDDDMDIRPSWQIEAEGNTSLHKKLVAAKSGDDTVCFLANDRRFFIFLLGHSQPGEGSILCHEDPFTLSWE